MTVQIFLLTKITRKGLYMVMVQKTFLRRKKLRRKTILNFLKYQKRKKSNYRRKLSIKHRENSKRSHLLIYLNHLMILNKQPNPSNAASISLLEKSINNEIFSWNCYWKMSKSSSFIIMTSLSKT